LFVDLDLELIFSPLVRFLGNDFLEFRSLKETKELLEIDIQSVEIHG